MTIGNAPSGEDRITQLNLKYENFKKAYEKGELKEDLQRFAIKYFNKRQNGNRFPGIIIELAKSLKVAPLITSKIVSKKVETDGYFEVDFVSSKEYEDFLDLLVRIVIYSESVDDIEYLLNYENFITFVQYNFSDIFGILGINSFEEELHPDIQNAQELVKGETDRVLKK